MKQKIVIKVHVRCDKRRSKAMKIAAVADGVISVALEGEHKDKVVVTGDGVDAANLTIQLSKKIGYACLVSVEEVEPPPPPPPPPPPSPPCESSCQHSQSQCQLYTVVYDPQPTNCTIM